MMHEIQEHRMKERDFTSLEDQIRCLRLRFDQLESNENDEEEMIKQQLDESNEEIDKLKQMLEEMRGQIKNKKKQHESLKEQFIALYHVEGEKNADIATLRGDTSKQLTSNEEFVAEIEKYKIKNQRLNNIKEENMEVKA